LVIFCWSGEKFQTILNNEGILCYGPYNQDNADTSNFTKSGITYSYTSDSETEDINGISYPLNGGFIIQLNFSNSTQVSSYLLNLQNSNWIDNQTRAVFFDFLLYNPNIDVIGIVTLFVETPEAGVFVPVMNVFPLKLFPYSMDGTLVILWIVLGIFILLKISEFLQKILRAKNAQKKI